LGSHVICSLYGIPFKKLDDLAAIKAAFDVSVEKMGATVLHKFSHQFIPQGVTILYALAESHLSCHTFPEKGSVALDCYTCGEINPRVGMDVIIEFFNPIEISMQELMR
jgi:S-adenosylmethionine decarboxylase